MDILVVFALVVVAIALLGATRLGWLASTVAAVVTAAVIAFITWLVFSEDGYVQNGSSKWETRGSGPHDLYIAAMVVGALLLVLYSVLAIRKTRGFAVTAAVVAGGLLEAIGLLVVALAFASN